MHPNKQLEIAKIYLNLTVSPKSTIFKQNTNKQVASKRFRYCYHKKHNNNQQHTATNYAKFNDSQHFYALNGNQNYSVRGSNLLNRSESRQHKQKQINNEKLESQKNDSSKNASTKIFNAQIFDQAFHFSEHISSLKSSQSKVRPKSSLDRFTSDKQQKKQKQTLTYQNIELKNSNNINPYTHQQYLYFRRKEKEKIKEKIQQGKKKELQISMMKPCQIFQKQLNMREMVDGKRPGTATQKEIKISFNRTLTSRIKKQESFIQPWQYTPWGNHEDYLN